MAKVCKPRVDKLEGSQLSLCLSVSLSFSPPTPPPFPPLLPHLLPPEEKSEVGRMSLGGLSTSHLHVGIMPRSFK